MTVDCVEFPPTGVLTKRGYPTRAAAGAVWLKIAKRVAERTHLRPPDPTAREAPGDGWAALGKGVRATWLTPGVGESQSGFHYTGGLLRVGGVRWPADAEAEDVGRILEEWLGRIRLVSSRPESVLAWVRPTFDRAIPVSGRTVTIDPIAGALAAALAEIGSPTDLPLLERLAARVNPPKRSADIALAMELGRALDRMRVRTALQGPSPANR